MSASTSPIVSGAALEDSCGTKLLSPLSSSSVALDAISIERLILHSSTLELEARRSTHHVSRLQLLRTHDQPSALHQ